jgi:hypothetical protein
MSRYTESDWPIAFLLTAWLLFLAFMIYLDHKECPGIHIRHDMMVHGTDTFRCAKPSPEAIKYFDSQN